MAQRQTTGILTTCVAVAVAVAACDKPNDAGRPVPPATVPAAVAATPQLWQPTTHPGVFDVGDLLEIGVVGLSAAGSNDRTPARVQADGTVPVPYLGPVPAAGRTADELATLLRDRYRTAQVVNDAFLSVRRLQVANAAGSVAPGPIGNYDLVRVVVNGLDMVKDAAPPAVGRVDGEGKLAIPLLGKVKVAGQTEVQATAAVVAAYKAAAILSDAHVSVLVLERAPADADHKSLPDGPIDPVPEALRPLYATR